VEGPYQGDAVGTTGASDRTAATFEIHFQHFDESMHAALT
jgi:hypothetical protein